MIELYNNFTMQSMIQQTHMLLTPSALAPFEMNPFIDTVPAFLSSIETPPYPNCSLSNRIKVTTTMGSEAFRHFVGANQVEMSNDQASIDELVKNVTQAKYSRKMMANPELPYLALAAFAQDQISVWDTSILLICHQLTKDYPKHKLFIGPLLDENGAWTSGILNQLENMNSFDESIRFSTKEKEQFRLAIQRLPLSQQIFYTTPSAPFLLGLELSLEAKRVLLSIKHKRHYGLEPRLGELTKTDILIAEIARRSRACYIPFPDVPVNLGNFEGSHSSFSGHDRGHLTILHGYPNKLFSAKIELIREFMKVTGVRMSKEIWNIADFARDLSSTWDNTYAFVRTDIYLDTPVWGWHAILHLRNHKERWEKEYSIGIERMGLLSLHEMNHLVDLAEPYLKDRPLLEQIYWLEELRKKGIDQKVDIDVFFKSSPSILNLAIENVGKVALKALTTA